MEINITINLEGKLFDARKILLPNLQNEERIKQPIVYTNNVDTAGLPIRDYLIEV